MYPAQTSLIPVQIALARFLEQSGLSAFFGNYPYWYEGTTPFRYLTGPILPSVLAVIHRLVPSLSLFEIMFGVIGMAWVIGGIGVYLLVRELGKGEESRAKKEVAFLAAIFYAFGPIVPFLFRFSDGLYLIAFSFLPFILLLYLRLLQNWTRKLTVSLVILISFVMLLDTLILPTLLLGMAAIFLAQVGWKRMEEKLKQSLLLIAYCLLLVTLWYTPGYWWTLLGAPSFGGKGLAQVIVWLGKLLPVVLAFTLAVFSAKFFKKRNILRDFCFYWLFIFGFLTLIRFLSDPDFWLDWTAYGVELQLGLAIALGLIIRPLFSRLSAIRYLPYAIFVSYFLLFTFIFNRCVLGALQRDIEQTVEYRIGSQLSEIANPPAGGEKVFLSGTTAFWLNAFFDISQVRGGRDQVSVDPNWREAAWKIRHGESADEAERALKVLKISYLVVHTEESEEFYHDFVYPERFENVSGLVKIYDQNGDRVYRVKSPN